MKKRKTNWSVSNEYLNKWIEKYAQKSVDKANKKEPGRFSLVRYILKP